MAKQNITLDELLTAIKGAKVSYAKTLIASNGDRSPQTITLARPITDFDFISIEAGDDTNGNPDNTLSLRLVDSITYNRMYADIGSDTNGGTPGNDAGINNAAAAHITFMFLDANTLKIIYQHNNFLKRLYGWKSIIEWGGGIVGWLKTTLLQFLLGGVCYGTN